MIQLMKAAVHAMNEICESSPTFEYKPNTKNIHSIKVLLKSRRARSEVLQTECCSDDLKARTHFLQSNMKMSVGSPNLMTIDLLGTNETVRQRKEIALQRK